MSNPINNSQQKKPRKLLTFCVILFGCFMIWRGLTVETPPNEPIIHKIYPKDVPSTVALWESGEGYKEFAKVKQPVTDFRTYVNESIAAYRTFWLKDGRLVVIGRPPIDNRNDKGAADFTVYLMDHDAQRILKTVNLPSPLYEIYEYHLDFDDEKGMLCYADQGSNRFFTIDFTVDELSLQITDKNQFPAGCFYRNLQKPSTYFGTTDARLLKNKGYLKFESHSSTTNTVLFADEKGNIKKLGFGIKSGAAKIEWSAFANGYLLDEYFSYYTIYADKNDKRMAAHYVYLWNPDSADNVQVFNLGKREHQRYYITKLGLTAFGFRSDYENLRILYPTEVHDHGVFLMDSAHDKPLVVGNPQGESVSPDGCRIALGLATEIIKTEKSAWPDMGHHMLTVINLCK